jgi:hypothetical protein
MMFTQSQLCHLKSLSAGNAKKSNMQQFFYHDDRITASQSWLLWSHRRSPDKSHSLAHHGPNPRYRAPLLSVPLTTCRTHGRPFAVRLRAMISSRIMGSEVQEERIGQLTPRFRAHNSDAIALMLTVQPARGSGRIYDLKMTRMSSVVANVQFLFYEGISTNSRPPSIPAPTIGPAPIPALESRDESVYPA